MLLLKSNRVQAVGGDSRMRLGARLFNDLATKVTKNVTLKRRIFVVPRENEFDQAAIGRYIIDPRTVFLVAIRAKD